MDIIVITRKPGEVRAMKIEGTKLVEAPRYQHVFTVGGRGAFPVDMLRYDSCWPKRAEDAAQIHDSDFTDYREVTLVHLGGKHWLPTQERWRSFGWGVTRS